MSKAENVIVRVYLEGAYWETGVLLPYFEDFHPCPDAHKTLFFRSDNFDFDAVSRCYIFRLPELGDASVLRDVHIPERFVLGIAARNGSEAREDMRKIQLGFV